MNKLLLALTLLFSFSAVAQTSRLIVSDVDDTIKVTDVLGNKLGVAYNGLFKTTAFAGMSELYSSFDREDASIYYVSASPKMIRNQIEKFLVTNKFPQYSNVILKDRMSDDTFNFKYNSIKELILKQDPEEVILIGDDTEHDPEVFHAIKNEFPKQVVAVYVRAVRNHLEAHQVDQNLFFSPIEIAGKEIVATRLSEQALIPVNRGFLQQTRDSEIVIKRRYCPKQGREVIEELKNEINPEYEGVFVTNQEKIIKTCR